MPTTFWGGFRKGYGWAYAWMVAAILAGCVAPIPVVGPGPSPGPVNPGPVDPGPVAPPADGEGSITVAAFDLIPDGAAETEVYGTLGKPFRRTETGGYVILVYAIRGSDSVAWFFMKNGNLERKRRL